MPVQILNDPEQIVDIPVPGHVCVGFGVLQGFHPEQSSTAPFVEQHVDFPVPGGGLQGFCPGQGSAAPSSSSHSPAGVLEDADEPFQGGFRTFLGTKKSARVAGQSSAQLGARSSTLSAHQMARGRAGDEGHERSMQVLNIPVSHDRPSTRRQWGEWRHWMGLPPWGDMRLQGAYAEVSGYHFPFSFARGACGEQVPQAFWQLWRPLPALCALLSKAERLHWRCHARHAPSSLTLRMPVDFVPFFVLQYVLRFEGGVNWGVTVLSFPSRCSSTRQNHHHSVHPVVATFFAHGGQQLLESDSQMFCSHDQLHPLWHHMSYVPRPHHHPPTHPHTRTSPPPPSLSSPKQTEDSRGFLGHRR